MSITKLDLISLKITHEELKEIIVKQEEPIYVYVDENDQVLGHLFLLIKVSDSPVRYPSKRLFIEDLCVDSSARGQRIGQQLCNFAKNLAREWECSSLTLNVWNDNTSAYDFYDHLGFKPQQTQMELLLQD